MKIGILAIQGAYIAHKNKMEKLGIDCILVKQEKDLYNINAIILPGGESTTMTILLKKHHLWKPLSMCLVNIPILATCAGLILLKYFGLINIKLQRNGYGNQLNSKIIPIEFKLKNDLINIDAYFIRAPIIEDIYDKNIKIISYYHKKAIFIKKNLIIASTFHPELSTNNIIHQHFIELIK